MNENQDDWSLFLAPIQYSLNNSFCRTLGMQDTPFNLMFGRDARTSLDIEWASITPYTENNRIDPEHKHEKIIKMSNAYQRVMQHLKSSLESYQKFYNEKEYNPNIRPGDRCMIKVTRNKTNKSRALTKGYEGPVRVLEALDYAIKCVPVARPDAAPKLVSRRRLKLIKQETYSPSVKEPVLDMWQELPNIDLQMEEESHSPKNIGDEQAVEPQANEDDLVEVSNEENPVTRQVEEEVSLVQNQEEESAEPIMENGEHHNLSQEQSRVRPARLRPHPKARNYGEDFVAGDDLIGALTA